MIPLLLIAATVVLALEALRHAAEHRLLRALFCLTLAFWASHWSTNA